MLKAPLCNCEVEAGLKVCDPENGCLNAGLCIECSLDVCNDKNSNCGNQVRRGGWMGGGEKRREAKRGEERRREAMRDEGDERQQRRESDERRNRRETREWYES